MGISLIEIMILATVGFVIVLLYFGSKRDSGYRRYHSESERIEYRTKTETERVAKEERDLASQRARHETGQQM